MTTNHAFPALSATTVPAARHRGRRHLLLRALRAIGRFYTVNWQRAAAQEYEYVRLREEAVRKYSAASGGRM